MKECLRLVAPVPVMARRAVCDTQIQDHFVPAGTYVSVVPHFTHHMPQYWPDPEHFDPERFADHRREDKVHRYAWEPFGGGVHKCLGMHFAGIEIKAIMHHLLTTLRLAGRARLHRPSQLHVLCRSPPTDSRSI